MKKLKLLVTDNVDRVGLKPLTKYFRIDYRIGIKETELKKIIGKYHSIITRTATALPSKIIESAGNLRIIGRAAIGVDNIDIFAATAKRIAVINAPKGNARSTAEHTIGLIISLLRHIPQAVSDLKKGIWGKTKYVGVQFKDKTLGIVGFGNVGKEVYRLARGLGMKVIVCEPYIRMPRYVEQVTYEELLKRSDIITFHVPNTYLTKQMLNKNTLALCREKVFIVNCSRGAVLDDKALIEALKSGKIAGLALDVFSQEPHVDPKILGVPNVIATPHIAGSTVESQRESIEEVVSGIKLYLKNISPSNLLNPQVFQKKDTKDIREKLEFSAVIFDCDSTVSSIEGIDELAAFKGIKEKIAPLTKEAQDGSRNFEEVFHKRLALIKPSRKDMDRLGELYVENLTEDAKETIEALMFLGKKIYLVSGGYTPALLKLAQVLKVPDENIFANDLIFKNNGNFLTHLEGPLKRNHGKLQIVRQIPGKKVMIGDGITDLETKALLDLFIGYGGIERRKVVESESDIYIYGRSLSPILVLSAGVEGCIKLLSTKYRKLVGKGLDQLFHPEHTKIKIGSHRRYQLSEYKKLAYF
ncbi:HAD-IB family phosphatase [Candidatus Gottesmanbacteria bacterium]|nr:HAD-IB family phosphatase [Candidatus Gottesmanbacteria bacterium]